MRLHRADLFPQSVEELAAFARALAHPARVLIIQMLLKEPTLCCRDIVARLPLAQPTVSQHLKALSLAGLLLHRENGLRIEYQLNRDRLKEFCHSFQVALETVEPTDLKPATSRPGVNPSPQGSDPHA